MVLTVLPPAADPESMSSPDEAIEPRILFTERLDAAYVETV